jgi:hypothetical protein
VFCGWDRGPRSELEVLAYLHAYLLKSLILCVFLFAFLDYGAALCLVGERAKPASCQRAASGKDSAPFLDEKIEITVVDNPYPCFTLHVKKKA